MNVAQKNDLVISNNGPQPRDTEMIEFAVTFEMFAAAAGPSWSIKEKRLVFNAIVQWGCKYWEDGLVIYCLECKIRASLTSCDHPMVSYAAGQSSAGISPVSLIYFYETYGASDLRQVGPSRELLVETVVNSLRP